jgi:subtilisin-like proprotein convertase family protein
MVGGSYVNDDAELLPPHKTIISEIEVNEDYLIGDLNVRLLITHTHVSFLDAYLTGPDGTRVELFAEIGGEGDHFDQTVFDDQSQFPIVKAKPPFKGSFMPGAQIKRQPSLSSFNGKSIKGVWQLVVRGTRSERFGMLHSWGLIVKPQDHMLDSTPAALPEDGSVASAMPSPGYQSGNGPATREAGPPRGDERFRESKQEGGESGEYKKDRDKEEWGSKKDGAISESDAKFAFYAAQLIKAADKNGDGVLTIDEYSEKDRSQFGTTDTNGDGRVDAEEVGAAILRLKGLKPQ